MSKVKNELALIEAVLKGYPASMARADALRAVKVVEREVGELTGSVDKFLKDNDPEGFGCACSPAYKCGPCSMAARLKPLDEALTKFNKEN